MKLKNVLFIAIAILTIGLFVACNDEVVAAKDNNVAYTQFLESNGAFEYGGTKYETLQDAIEAIDKAKGYAPKTIKVLRDGVKTGAATVPSTITGDGIALDLNGNSLSFLSSTGVTVNGVFRVTGNGEITLDDKSADATAFAVGKGGYLAVVNTTFNVADQYAVKANGAGAEVVFGNGAAVAGNVGSANGANVTLDNGSEVSGLVAVSGTGATLTIGDGSTVAGVLTADDAGKLIINGGDYSNTGILVDKGTLKFNDDVESATLSSVGVVNGGEVDVQENVSITNLSLSGEGSKAVVGDGATLTLPAEGTIQFDEAARFVCAPYGALDNKTSTPIPAENLVQGAYCYIDKVTHTEYYQTIQQAINDSSNNDTIVMLFDTNTVEGQIETSISFPAALSEKTLTLNMNGNTIGTDTNKVTVTVGLGNTLRITQSSSAKTTDKFVGSVNGNGSLVFTNVDIKGSVTEATPVEAYSSIFESNIGISTAPVSSLISESSEFKSAVYAGSLTDGTVSGSGTTESPYVYSKGSTFNEAITSSGTVLLRNSTTKDDISAYTKIEAHNALIGDFTTSADDDLLSPVVVIDDSTVKAKDIKAASSEAAKVVSLTALKGASTITSVYGAYDGSTSGPTYSNYNNTVVYITKASGTLSLGNASNDYAVSASGHAYVSPTDPEVKAIIIADTENTETITNKITINSAVTGTTAGEVRIVGKANHVVSAATKITSAGSVYVDYATVTGTEESSVLKSVYASGSVTTRNSTFSGTVETTSTVVDGVITGETSPYEYSDGSDFHAITASGAITLYNSTTRANVTSGDSVSAFKATLGVNSGTPDDSIYAPTITVDAGSVVSLNRLMRSYTPAAGSNPEVPVAATSVSVKNSSGTIYRVYAQQSSNTLNAITLSSSTSGALTIGNTLETDDVVNAAVGNVIIDGNSSYGVIVEENVLASNGGVVATYATLNGNVTGTGALSFENSTLTGNSNKVHSTGTSGSITANTVTFGVKNGTTWTAGPSLETGVTVTVPSSPEHDYSDTTGGTISITSGIGKTGTIRTHKSDITINNSGATDSFEPGQISTMHYMYDYSESQHDVYSYADVSITGPNTSGNQVLINYLTIGKDIKMYAGNGGTATAYSDYNSLVVNEIVGSEFQASGTISIFGGKYGVGTDGSVVLGTNINVYGGEFYVNHASTLENILANTESGYASLPITVKLFSAFKKITPINASRVMVRDVSVGGGAVLGANKAITIMNGTTEDVEILVPYKGFTSETYNYYSNAINLTNGGKLKFDGVSVSAFTGPFPDGTTPTTEDYGCDTAACVLAVDSSEGGTIQFTGEATHDYINVY